MQVDRSVGVQVEDVPLKKGVRGEVSSAEDAARSPAPQVVPPAAPAVPSLPKQEKPSSAVSLLANKYILLNPAEGCPLHKCIDIVTEQEYVCRAWLLCELILVMALTLAVMLYDHLARIKETNNVQ